MESSLKEFRLCGHTMGGLVPYVVIVGDVWRECGRRSEMVGRKGDRTAEYGS